MTDENDLEISEFRPGEEIGNAADPDDQRVRREKKQEQVNESAAFWKRVFADPIGRREMWGILQSAHAFETIFACGPSGFPQPESTWFQAGQQDFGQRLYQSWLVMDREGVWLMQSEHDSRYPKPVKRVRRVRKDE